MLRRLVFIAFGILFFFNFEIAFGKEPSPYFFVENKGQWPEKVLLKTDIKNGKMFLQANALVYLFYDIPKHPHPTKSDINSKPFSRAMPPPQEEKIAMHAIEVSYLNSNPKVRIEKSKVRREQYNIIKGQKPSNWGTSLSAFEEITYRELYNGIDLKFYSYHQNLKYDFVIEPGSNPEQIKISYKGEEKISIQNGNLHITSSVNQIIENKPFAYQIVKGDTIEVKCNYRFGAGRKYVGFEFPEGYDKKHSLVIDPILVFSTFSGSTADNWGFTATYDEQGNLYSGGIVFNPGLPTTTGAFQINFADSIDIAIMKFDSSGQNLLYGTYLGGNEVEAPSSLVVNNLNELLILGTSSSSDYPTSSNAYDKIFNGGNPIEAVSGVAYVSGADIIISKLNSTGNALLASTYLGGSQSDGVSHLDMPLVINYGDAFRGDIITTTDNSILITTQTQSLDFPIKNGFQSAFGGGVNDGIIVKLNHDLSDILWSSFLGGQDSDASYSIKLDASENVIVAGGTISSDFPTSPSSLNPIFQGFIDGFISKISSDGSSILSSTFLGTIQYDQIFMIDLDLQGNVYAIGQTTGNYPIIGDVYNNQGGGQFIHKLDGNLSRTEFSTVFGKFDGLVYPNLVLTAFMVSDCENIYVAGWGETSGMSISPDAFQATTDGSDFYLMVLGKNAESLLYATYFGAKTSGAGFEHVDGGTSRFDKKGIVYQAVCASCGYGEGQNPREYPVTPGAWSETNNSENCNMAAFKFDLSILDAQFTYTSEYKACQTIPTFSFKDESVNADSYFWDFGDGNTSTEQNPIHQYTSSGNFEIKLISSNRFCFSTVVKKVKIIALVIPNVITPNDDGQNDKFEIISQEPLNVTIYNRWGKEVFSQKNYQNKWTAEGLSAGVYFYSVEDQNDNNCKGWVQVLK